MSADRLLAVTHSAWINAWSLRRACAEIGVDLRVEVDRRELPLPRLARGAAAQWQFLTDERSLVRALQAGATPRHWPQTFPATLLDDKWAFAQWLAADAGGPPGLPQWSVADAATARWPLLLKSRHSWRGDRKLPRGWVCRDQAELSSALARLSAEGLDPHWFFLQRWFDDTRLLSVAGYFDAADESRNLACLTERLADYGAGPSSSALLATIEDPGGHVALAERLLRRLGYRGPYEIEFVVEADGRSWVLELNPRFWMQHGLFLACGNGLVKRYLGVETAAERRAAVPAGLLWADGFWLARRLARCDLRVGRLLWQRVVRGGQRLVVCPTLPAVAQALAWRLLGGR